MWPKFQVIFIEVENCDVNVRPRVRLFFDSTQIFATSKTIFDVMHFPHHDISELARHLSLQCTILQRWQGVGPLDVDVDWAAHLHGAVLTPRRGS